MVKQLLVSNCTNHTTMTSMCSKYLQGAVILFKMFSIEIQNEISSTMPIYWEDFVPLFVSLRYSCRMLIDLYPVLGAVVVSVSNDHILFQ